MSKEELDLRVRFAFAKGRNIIYYRKLDKQLGRVRVQYVHVLREYREALNDLVSKMGPGNDRDTLKKIMSVIDPKVLASECERTIKNIETILDGQEKA